MFQHITIIGIGMIGGSVALAARACGMAKKITAMDISLSNLEWATESGMIDGAVNDVGQSDLVVLAMPVGSYGTMMHKISEQLQPGALVTDVGSTKRSAMRDAAKYLPLGAFIGGHPIAGREKHGPQHAQAGLFQGRWCILTPPDDVAPTDIEKIQRLWEAMGSKVAIMDAAHHDRVLAITSHLPQLIARTIVGTAADLEKEMQEEVIQFSAGGFRDFTRMAAADPIMWRDIFLENKDAVLEMLQRLSEDIGVMQRHIRNGDGPALQDLFARAQSIRQQVIDARQD